MLRVAAVGVVAVAIGAVLFISDSRNIDSINNRSAEAVTSSGVYGPYIGRSIEDFDHDAFVLGISRANFIGNGQCLLGDENIPGQALYEDNSWRNGVLCLVAQNDTITRIIWHYAPMGP